MADSRSGGGIARGGSVRGSAAEGMRGFRRRWASGVAVVTARDGDGIRGVTVSGLLPLGIDPASLVFALQADSSFHEVLEPGDVVGISLLHRNQEFLAERFAGRAPVPDGKLTGVPHRELEGAVVLDGAIAVASGRIRVREPMDDHVLVIVDVDAVDLPPDTDEPMVFYEGAYRDLEPA